MATTMERFDQVVVGGAACSSEVKVSFFFFCFYSKLSFFFCLGWLDGIGLSQHKHLLCGICSMYILICGHKSNIKTPDVPLYRFRAGPDMSRDTNVCFCCKCWQSKVKSEFVLAELELEAWSPEFESCHGLARLACRCSSRFFEWSQASYLYVSQPNVNLPKISKDSDGWTCYETDEGGLIFFIPVLFLRGHSVFLGLTHRELEGICRQLKSVDEHSWSRFNNPVYFSNFTTISNLSIGGSMIAWSKRPFTATYCIYTRKYNIIGVLLTPSLHKLHKPHKWLYL